MHQVPSTKSSPFTAAGLAPYDVPPHEPDTNQLEYKRAPSAGWSHRDLLAVLSPSYWLPGLPPLWALRSNPDTEFRERPGEIFMNPNV